MAGYYINGLLNTETAWDSYCTYGYKSNIDKRYFCAVQTSDIFYASLRDSAYINVYIYCKGQQVSTLKCISNTGSEYDVSTSYYSTVDPTVAIIYKHPVWSNMNGRQVTMADFLSNAPILYGVNLSDAERDALAINYLNNVPEPYGQGTVTLTIKRPGQTLNFASRLLGETLSYYVDSNATVVFGQSSAISVLKESGSYTFDYSPNGSVCYTFTNTQLENLVKLYINKIHSTVSSNFDTYLNQGSRAFSQSFGEDAYMTNCLPRKATEEMTTLQIWDSRSSGTIDINSTIILFSDAECTRVTKNRIYTGTTPTLVSSVQLSAGKYALFGSTEAPRIDVSGTEIRDSNDNIICKRCSKSYPPNTPSYVQSVGLVELVEDTTISLYAYGSSSYYDEQNDIFALKINSAGSITTKSFSDVSSTSYENIKTLTLSTGKYLLVSEVTFGTSDISYAQKVTIGSDIVIYDTGLGGSPSPISSSMSYIDILGNKTLTLSVKTSSNGVSISGYIKAMRIA